MPYCIQDDLLKLIPERDLADITAEAGDIPDATVVAEAITAAGGEIDSYLGKRYQVPLAPVPDQVKALAVDLTLYRLYSRRSLAPEVRRQRYEDAIRFLKDVAQGRAVITGATGLEEPSVQQEVTEVSSAERVFSREKMRGW